MEPIAPLTVSVPDLHEWRQQIDADVECAKRMLAERPEKGGREIAIAHTKLQEAKMWIGKVLEELGSELPAEFRDRSQ